MARILCVCQCEINNGTLETRDFLQLKTTPCQQKRAANKQKLEESPGNVEGKSVHHDLVMNARGCLGAGSTCGASRRQSTPTLRIERTERTIPHIL